MCLGMECEPLCGVMPVCFTAGMSPVLLFRNTENRQVGGRVYALCLKNIYSYQFIGYPT